MVEYGATRQIWATWINGVFSGFPSPKFLLDSFRVVSNQYNSLKNIHEHRHFCEVYSLWKVSWWSENPAKEGQRSVTNKRMFGSSLWWNSFTHLALTAKQQIRRFESNVMSASTNTESKFLRACDFPVMSMFSRLTSRFSFTNRLTWDHG